MIRILIVDDQKVIRECLKTILESEPDLEVVGTAISGKTAIQQVNLLQPDLILIDLEMPDLDGLTATKIILEQHPQTKVLVLSSHEKNEYIIQSLRAGAKGYLLKSTSAQELVQTIRSVYKGYLQIGPGLFEKIIAHVPEINVQVPELVGSSSSIALKPTYFSSDKLQNQSSSYLVFNSDETNLLPSQSTQSTHSSQEVSWQQVLGILITVVSLTGGLYFARQQLRNPAFSNNLPSQNQTINGVEFIGIVKPAKTIKIVASSSAIVEDIYQEIGVKVTQGQKLLKLKNLTVVQEQQQLQQQQQQIDSQKQQLLQQQQTAQQQIALLEQKIIYQQQTLAPLRSQMAQASLKVTTAQNKANQISWRQQQQIVAKHQVIYQQAVANYQKLVELSRQGAIAQQKVEQAQTEIKLAEADLQIAQTNLDAAKAEASKKSELAIAQQSQSQLQLNLAINQQESEIQQLQEQLEVAVLNEQQIKQRIDSLISANRSTQTKTPQAEIIITATATGAIAELPLKIGDRISANNTLAVLTDTKKLKAEVTVDARLINSLKINQPALVTIKTAEEEQKIIGKIVAINPIPSQNLDHTVEIEFSNNSNAFLIGQTVAVNFIPEK